MTNLAEIETRILADRDDFGSGFADQSIRDREALVALVKAQAAKLDAVRDLANWSGVRGWNVNPKTIRATMDAA